VLVLDVGSNDIVTVARAEFQYAPANNDYFLVHPRPRARDPRQRRIGRPRGTTANTGRRWPAPAQPRHRGPPTGNTLNRLTTGIGASFPIQQVNRWSRRPDFTATLVRPAVSSVQRRGCRV